MKDNFISEFKLLYISLIIILETKALRKLEAIYIIIIRITIILGASSILAIRAIQVIRFALVLF